MLNVKKINVADFSKTNTADMQKLARSLNPFFDSVQQVLDKGLTVSKNLPFEYVTFEVTVDSSGVPLSSVKFPISLTAIVQGMDVINVTGAIPTACPFVLHAVDKNIVTVTHVLGLPANTKCKITVMVLS